MLKTLVTTKNLLIFFGLLIIIISLIIIDINLFKQDTEDTNKSTLLETPIITVEPKEVMAWIYPGSEPCNLDLEYGDGRNIDILKPEYFTINEDGQLILLTETSYGCNAYSIANVASIKQHSQEQFVTISSNNAASMDIFLTSALSDNDNIDTLVQFVVDNELTGIEIDFEDFSAWTTTVYEKYKEFITKLGNSLHENNKKLMIDGPATSNSLEEAWYIWRYSDFNDLPIDHLVIMVYDYQYNHGVGKPIAPISWIEDTIEFTSSRFIHKSKLSIGVPSYGYMGNNENHNISLLTYNQIKNEPGFETAKRDKDSQEMTWQNGETIYYFQDAESIARKIKAIKEAGIESVSIWHLGGNLWF